MAVNWGYVMAGGLNRDFVKRAIWGKLGLCEG